MITRDQLLRVLPFARSKAGIFLGPLNAAMAEYEINTGARQAAFIAQVGHESGSLVYMKEIASGEAYDTGSLAARLGNTPEKDGDGQRYKGRGLIQITGHDNYLECSMALYGDGRLLRTPELLEQPVDACRSAGWFWHQHGLNGLADVGNFKRITKIINGGYNGYEERVKLYQRALLALAPPK